MLNEPELSIYFKSENIENTNLAHEVYDPRRPDAYIGFTNNIFNYPNIPYSIFDTIEWFENF